MNLQPHIVFGGTFDPIHLGHIQITKSICQHLNTDKVNLMPDYQTVHRDQPLTSLDHRLQMLKITCANEHHLTLDLREVNRTGPSYTILSVQEIRAELIDQCPLYFVIGSDSLFQFDQWHRWQEILDYCHLLVAPRKEISESMNGSLNSYLRDRIDSLENIQSSFGKIVYLEHEICSNSSSEIRQLRQANQSIDHLVSDDVADYIYKNNLYLLN